MGGGQSKGDKDKRRNTIKDILTFLEEEVKKWNDNIANLKESLNKGQSDWIPAYLKCNIDETETRWNNFKASVIQPITAHHDPHDNRQLTAKAVDGGGEIKHTSDELRQLEANNETLLQKSEAVQAENVKLKTKLQDYERTLQRDGNQGSGTYSKQSEEVNSNSSKPPHAVNSMLNEGPSEDNKRSEKDDIITTLNEKIKEKEEEFQRLKSDMDKLSSEKKASDERVRDVEKEKEELFLRLTKEKETAEKNGSDLRMDSNLKSKDDQKDSILQTLQVQLKQTEEERLKMFDDNQVVTAEKESLLTKVNELQKEKETLLLRLSKIAGDKLVNNNPAITDLSDPNRPTKLGEVYNEIYDNEWTDAFDALKGEGYQDEIAIETLRLTLENVIQFCESKAKHLIKKSSDAVNLLFEEFQQSVVQMKMPSHLTMPRKQAQEIGQLVREKTSMEDIKLQLRWKQKTKNREGGQVTQTPGKAQTAETSNLKVDSKLKQFRKEMATSMVPIVQKAYIEASWADDCIQELKPYIVKCLYLGWMMVVQSPPMVLHKSPSDQGIKFDKNVHKEYTVSGPLVSYVVWPALLLNENGPVVCKGVAQGKKPNTKDTK